MSQTSLVSTASQPASTATIPFTTRDLSAPFAQHKAIPLNSILSSLLKHLEAQSPCFCWEQRDPLSTPLLSEAPFQTRFLAFNPSEVLRIQGGRLEHERLTDATGRPLHSPQSLYTGYTSKAIFSYLEQQLQSRILPRHDNGSSELPAFYGGYAGFYGYDMVQYEEPIAFAAPDNNTPDALFYRFDQVVVFNESPTGIQATLYVHPHPTLCKTKTPEPLQREALESHAEALSQKLAQELAHLLQAAISPPDSDTASETTDIQQHMQIQHKQPLHGQPTLGKARFCEQVATLQDAIQRGDIFQAVLSERFTATTTTSPLELYTRLHQVNPSPYHFYLNLPEISMLGASPEMLVHQNSQHLITHPIAGTRPRGKTPEADQQLEQELLACEKERAEHLMLVDLARNDIGRVAVPGSVQVTRFQQVVRFSHVMHLVSEVQGDLPSPAKHQQIQKQGQTQMQHQAAPSALTSLRACFPAGTLSGAPKVRAMQYLAKLEPLRRKWYGGAVFYLGFDQHLEACIAIRSLCFQKQDDAPHKVHETHQVPSYQLEWQAGAGIVADSVPELEYAEVCHKAQALLAVAS